MKGTPYHTSQECKVVLVSYLLEKEKEKESSRLGEYGGPGRVHLR